MENIKQIYQNPDYFENGKRAGLSNYIGYNWQSHGSLAHAQSSWLYPYFIPKTVLDVGCAKGLAVSLWRTMANIDAYGVDISEYAISQNPKMKKKYLKVCDIATEKLPFDDNYFDLVTCFETMEHIPEKEVDFTFLEIHRVMKLSGHGVFSIALPESVFNEKDIGHITLRQNDFWKEKLCKYFIIEDGHPILENPFIKSIGWNLFIVMKTI